MNIDELVLTEDDQNELWRKYDPEEESWEDVISRATVKKVVKYIDKERGAWYNGGVIIGKEVWETLAKSLEEG